MDTTDRRRGTTLTKRMTAAAVICKRIGQLPLGLDTSLHLLNTNALSGATYGCECTPVNVSAARRLRTEIVTAAVGPHYSSSAPEILLQASASSTLDPELKVLELRLVALRRGVHKNIRRGPTTHSCVHKLLQHYMDCGEYMMGGNAPFREPQLPRPWQALVAADGECRNDRQDQLLYCLFPWAHLALLWTPISIYGADTGRLIRSLPRCTYTEQW